MILSSLLLALPVLPSTALPTALPARVIPQSEEDQPGIAGPRDEPVDEFHPDRDREVTPGYGGSVTVHLPRLPRNINYMIENSSYTRWFSWELHEYLVMRDWETWELEPRLARRWDTEDTLVLKGGRGEGKENILYGKVTEDGDDYVVQPLSPAHDLAEPARVPKSEVESLERGTVFTFHLRNDALWHDGHPFDADDVLFSYRCYRNPNVDCDKTRPKFEKILHGEKIDEHTVRFFYSEQYFDALTTFYYLFLLPSHLYDLNDPDHPNHREEGIAGDEELAAEVNGNIHNTEWIGLGPYRMTSWGQDVVVGERFDDYFDPSDGGYLDEIRWRHIPNDYTSIQALINGDLDFSLRITSEDYFGAATATEEFRKDFYKGYYYVGAFNYFVWNMRKPLFADLRVRKALTHAMDMEEYRRTVGNGLANLPTGPQFYYGKAYNHEVERLPYDPARAEELLAEAGWYDRDGDGVIDKDGIPFEFELLAINANKASITFVQKLQESLVPLGIKAEIVTYEWATFLERVHNREFDAAGLAWTLNVPEDDPEQLWHSSQADKPRTSNHPGVSDVDVDALIAQGQRELDDEKRWAIWRELHRYLDDEVHPYLYRLAPPRKFAMNKRIRGFETFKINPGYSIRRWFLPLGSEGTRPARERN